MKVAKAERGKSPSSTGPATAAKAVPKATAGAAPRATHMCGYDFYQGTPASKGSSDLGLRLLGPPEDHPLSLDEAADVWSIILGLALEEKVDGVGLIIEDSVAEERERQEAEKAMPPLLCRPLVTTANDWTHYLLDLRSALESMTKGARLANARLLWRWLDHRCTDEARGFCVGHMPGRVADILSLLVAAMESAKDEQDVPAHHLDLCTVWYRRMALFLPTHGGSRKGQGLPVLDGMPHPVLAQHPLPDMGSDSEAGDTEARRAMRTNRAHFRDFDGVLEENRLEAAAEEAENAALQEILDRDLEAEHEEVQASADRWMEDESLLSSLSASEYQAWERRAMKRALTETPARNLDVEGQSETPYASPKRRACLQPYSRVTVEDESVSTPPTHADTAPEAGVGAWPIPLHESAGVTQVLGETAGPPGSSDEDTVLVAPPASAVSTGVAGVASTSLGASNGVGSDVAAEMHFQMPDLSMEQYQHLYQQWLSGLVTLAEVEEGHGREVREMMELQMVAEARGLETQV
ncbi:unnamed protein product [Symbiodinium sp. CCMP2592]|nr:unnamed protein product [Symbiodinium sp. CCMP2592]